MKRFVYIVCLFFLIFACSKSSVDDSNPEGENPDGTHKESWTDVGFLAQDVEKIDPEWVVPPSNEDDHYLINYDNFTVLAIKAIQEQQELIFSLQEEVKNIKRELRK